MKRIRAKRMNDMRARDLKSIRALSREERVARALSLLGAEAEDCPFRESTEDFLVRHGYGPDEVAEAKVELSRGAP